MAGCAKVVISGNLAIIVAGGQNTEGHALKSAEMISLSTQLKDRKWVQLADLNYARSQFPSLGKVTTLGYL